MQLTYLNVPYEIADVAGGAVSFVFGIRKSGSSILNSIVISLAKKAQVNYVDVAGKMFEAGVTVAQWQGDRELASILRPGNVYGGFRNFPEGLLGDRTYESARKILLVRDPRDALVSEYFSNAFSHSLPEQGEAREQMLELREEARHAHIEQFVIQRAPAFAKTMREYRPLVDDGQALVLKYEDFIPDKRTYIHRICEHFGWPVDDHFVSLVLSWADVIPEEERPTQFVRKVTPGDHKDKLRQKTIDKLGEMLGDEMAMFGYEP